MPTLPLVLLLVCSAGRNKEVRIIYIGNVRDVRDRLSPERRSTCRRVSTCGPRQSAFEGIEVLDCHPVARIPHASPKADRRRYCKGSIQKRRATLLDLIEIVIFIEAV